MIKLPKRAALMCRVSSDEQALGYSLDVQWEDLHNYCKRNYLDVGYEFREDHSAKDFNRPAFKEFLKFVSKEKFSSLLFSFKRFEVKAVWIGAIAAIILAAFFQFLWGPLMEKLLPNEKIDLSAFDSIRGNIYNYIFILLVALLLGGFFEEIFFLLRQ